MYLIDLKIIFSIRCLPQLVSVQQTAKQDEGKNLSNAMEKGDDFVPNRNTNQDEETALKRRTSSQNIETHHDR